MNHKYTGVYMDRYIHISKFKKMQENFFFLFTIIGVPFPFKVLPRCIMSFFILVAKCVHRKGMTFCNMQISIQHSTDAAQSTLQPSSLSQSETHGSYHLPDLFTWMSHSNSSSTWPTVISSATPFFMFTVVQIATNSFSFIINVIWEE